MKKLVLENVSL